MGCSWMACEGNRGEENGLEDVDRLALGECGVKINEQGHGQWSQRWSATTRSVLSLCALYINGQELLMF